ncbi:MAG TPA: phosphatase PAP2 family protein, partial [Albitalea sp.]|nr:phosphatase PAP2 family protein [Albitalea sp.]
LSARQAFQWEGIDLVAELDWLHVRAPDGAHTDARIGLQWRASLDEPFRQGRGVLGSALSGASASPWSPWLVGAGLVAGAAVLDRPLDNYAREHGGSLSARGLRDVGNVLPMVGFGLAGTSWLMSRGTARGDVGFSAIAAGLTAVTITEATKVVVDRARPSAELGPASFGDMRRRRESSFPSFHTALAWAVATPYAEHYDAPWLYGAAALTNAARVLGRRHWLSDTVAGAVLGYAIGDRFYRASGAARGDRLAPQLNIGLNAVTLNLPFE